MDSRAGLRAMGPWRLWPWLLPAAPHPYVIFPTTLFPFCLLLGFDPARLGGPLEVSLRSDPGAGTVQPQFRHDHGGWRWQLGQEGECSGRRACPGTCSVSREQCPAVSEAGRVLTAAVLLVWTSEGRGPHSGNPAMGEAKKTGPHSR